MDLQIEEMAQLVLSQYGHNAGYFAGDRISEFLYAGDAAGVERWREISAAIKNIRTLSYAKLVGRELTA